MPSWISAVSPVLALLVSAFALVVVGRVLRSEARRFAVVEQWYAEYRDDRIRAQAQHVCAWPVSERETFQKVIQHGVVGAAVRNASQAPVYDVELRYADPDAAWACVRRIRMIPPGDEPQIYAGFDEEHTTGNPRPDRINPDGSVRTAPSAEMRLELRFTDGHGRRWIRDQYGELSIGSADDLVPAAQPEQ